jgi:hypothetical protein
MLGKGSIKHVHLGQVRGAGGQGRARRRLAGTSLAAVAIALAGAAPAGAANLHPHLLTVAGYGPAPIGFARSADGRLHLAFETNTSWGNSASGVGALSISPSGSVGPTVQALSWTSTSGGSPNGIPGLAVLPSGALEATFGGSPSGVDGPWGISSTDGGATWTAPVNVGSGSMSFGDSAVGISVSNGTPVLAAGCCGNIVIQQGLGAATPTSQLTDTSDDAAGSTNIAVDAATGTIVTSWDSNAGSGGLWMQQAAPTVGAAQKAPVPSQYGTGTPLIIAGRDSGAGVFAGYPADTGPTTHMRLLRYGGGSVAVGSVKGLHAADWGVATGLSGRIWVMWYGQLNGKGALALTRSNKAVTRFEPIQVFGYDPTSLFTMTGDGRLGPLDLLLSGIGAGKPVNGLYFARELPVLSATVAVSTLTKTKFKLKVAVTDAGDAVAGATVTAKGTTAKTTAKGLATLTVTGTAGAHVQVKITEPGYNPLNVDAAL